ncbi:probable alpha-aspartyl dipeptidase [Contarinia nasturtii]|uniref:probable alpha-aspartyl dipeptidase n=1 Tax=Contarinia nasturtii TaxID=265458 RepID=UPI0012D3879E|nr:probable alpha-aspartyl dipeptidase [Contarinia nasturtii]
MVTKMYYGEILLICFCSIYSVQTLPVTMVRRQLMLLSSTMVHGYEIMQQQKPYLIEFFKRNNVSEVIFVPYAKVNGDYDGYTKMMADAIATFELQTSVKGLHTFDDPVEAIKAAQCIYIGGGNSFVLLKKLYDLNLVELIHKRVLEDGMAYMGSSAGSNVATRSIQTTNDMPIIYPPSFDALNLVPFNINPHYIDADKNSTHKGETREDRIKEFHIINEAAVLGLPEGTLLAVDDNKATLKGIANARLFTRTESREYQPESDLSFLLEK